MVGIYTILPLHINSTTGVLVDSPYPVMSPVQRKRFQARHLNTTYCYDFLDLFRQAIAQSWVQPQQQPHISHQPRTAQVLQARELVLAKGSKGEWVLEETDRPQGRNDIGMVAWRATLFTPEYPQGREIIIIANGILHTTGHSLFL